MDFKVISPKTKPELLKMMKQNKDFRFGAGYTDLILDLKKKDEDGITIINLAQLQDKQFSCIEKTAGGLRIGSLVSIAQIEDSDFIKKNFPVLQQAAENLASSQIRQVATVGGNICTASPSGDVACALVALKAKCEILSSSGKLRSVPIAEFFTGPRKTVLKKQEVLRSIMVPLNSNKHLHSGFVKIGTRQSMECSVVSLAYHIQSNAKQKITGAGVAIGSVAPTIRFAEKATDLLNNKVLTEIKNEESAEFAEKVMSYASPISDVRASDWYRREVLFNVCKSILER